MEFDLDVTDFEVKFSRIKTETRLGIRYAVIAALALASWISGFSTSLNSRKKALKADLPSKLLLESERMNFSILRMINFELCVDFESQAVDLSFSFSQASFRYAKVSM